MPSRRWDFVARRPLAWLVTALILPALLASGVAAVEVPFSDRLVIAPSLDGASEINLGDVDGDGDLDVVAVGDTDEVAWWENTAGDGSTWTKHTITTGFDTWFDVGDIDGDGDLDVVACDFSPQDVVWFENTVGDGSAWVQRAVDLNFPSPRLVSVADVDSDGDLDVLAVENNDFAPFFAWWRNEEGDGSSWTRISIGLSAATMVRAGDMDGDGDLDLLSAVPFQFGPGLFGLVEWWRYEDGLGTNHERRVINANYLSPRQALPGDVDGDGDLDAMFLARGTGLIGWAENEAGDGTTWTDHEIATGLLTPHALVAADLDQDGDLDAIGTELSASAIRWWENVDSAGGTWLARHVAFDVDEALDVEVGDLDGDGDLDIVAPESEGGRISWWRNESVHIFTDGFESGDTARWAMVAP